MDGFIDEPAAVPPEIRSGDLLGGRFRVVEELGSGGSSSIFLAEDLRLGEVAIKILHPEICADATSVERFRTEIRLTRAIRHPSVCPVFDLVVFENRRGTAILAATMKYLRGETLASRLARGPIPHLEAMRIIRDIAAGVDALHAEGIVHCDLKPANVMLTQGRDGKAVPPFPAEELLPSVIRRTTEDAPPPSKTEARCSRCLGASDCTSTFERSSGAARIRGRNPRRS